MLRPFGLQPARIRGLGFGAVAAAIDALNDRRHAHRALNILHVFGIVQSLGAQPHPVGKGAQTAAPNLRA